MLKSSLCWNFFLLRQHKFVLFSTQLLYNDRFFHTKFDFSQHKNFNTGWFPHKSDFEHKSSKTVANIDFCLANINFYLENIHFCLENIFKPIQTRTHHLKTPNFHCSCERATQFHRPFYCPIPKLNSHNGIIFNVVVIINWLQWRTLFLCLFLFIFPCRWKRTEDKLLSKF
jgi:hypothetical protein